MQTQEFIGRVQQQVGSPVAQAQAETAVDATLQVLGCTLGAGEASRLAAQLPAELEAAVTRDPAAEAPPDAEAFCGRVAEVANVSPGQARDYAEATLTVLGQAVSSGEATDVALQVPPFVSELMAR